jgi:pyruvate formate lyase activating enzyme
MIKGKISKIETLGLVDGPGIRVVVFLSGCPLRCKYCHNPEMWDINSGKEYTAKELLDVILKYKNYFGVIGGVTFSGGEPLLQSVFLLEVLKLCKENNISTALDTSGCIINKEVLKYVDLVILDIKALDNDSYKEMTGRNIENSFGFLKSIQELNIDLWLRCVIIPGINDNKKYIEKLYSYIKNIKFKKIELLPYHTMGVSKYK